MKARLGSLRVGTRFMLLGEIHRLLYRNECRALVQPIKKIRRRIRAHDTNGNPVVRDIEAQPGAISICPDVMVEVVHDRTRKRR